MKKIIVTGVTGQDGSNMVDYLLRETDHTIIGGARRLSVKNHKNIEHLEDEGRFFSYRFRCNRFSKYGCCNSRTQT